MEKITLPDGWHEVSIRTFQELSNIKTENGMNKIVDLISVLTDIDSEEIKTMSVEDFNLILPKIEWTSKQPTEEYKTNIVINDKEYFLVKLNTLSVGEWIDLDSWVKDSIANIHKIFALLYRPANEEYDTVKRVEREELFLDKMIISDVYGTLLFFLAIGNQYLNLIKDYTTKPITTME